MNPEIFPTWVWSILNTHKHERVARQHFEGFLVLESKPQIASQNTLAFVQTETGRHKKGKKRKKKEKRKDCGTDPVSI